MIAFRAALVSVVVLCTSAETPGEFSDTSTMLQKMEIMKSPKKNEKRQPEPEPHIIGLRRESVPIYRRGKIASFKTSYSGVLSVGSPSQHFRVVFDTGSGNIVLPAKECSSEACLVEGRRRFDMRASSTGVAINADGSIPTGGLTDRVTIGFGTGEITGEFAKDIVCFGTASAQELASADVAGAGSGAENATSVVFNETQTRTPDDAANVTEKDLCVEMDVVLAVEMSTQPFKTFKFDGILGLGLDGLAMSSNFSAFMQLFSLGHVAAPRFGVFLTEGEEGEESEIAMGGHDSRRMLEPLTYAPVVMSDYGYWQVAISAVRVGGVELDICKDGTCRGVVDTGTSHLGIPAPADQELTDLLSTEAGDMLDCRLAESPEVEFEISGYALKLQPFNYMRRLPLRDDVTVSSPKGVTTAPDPEPAQPAPPAPTTARYVSSAMGEYCAEGTEITSEEGCRDAAAMLGFAFEGSWEGPGDHRYCVAMEGGDGRAVYFNAASHSASQHPRPFYNSLCTEVVKTKDEVAPPQTADPSPAALADAAPAPSSDASPAVDVATEPEVVKRFCRPRVMPVRLPAPLGPKLFILGEPVLHRYYTVYDASTRSVGFALANNRRNTMDPASIVDRRGALPKDVDMLLMQNTVTLSQVQREARITDDARGVPAGGDAGDDLTILVQVTMRLSVKSRC